jgi:hypothetical protein
MTRSTIPFPRSGGDYVFDGTALRRAITPAPPAARPAAPESPAPETRALPTHDDIVAAIGLLDAADTSLWTRTGKPRVEAIERVLDHAITESQRDAAWRAHLNRTAEE